MAKSKGRPAGMLRYFFGVLCGLGLALGLWVGLFYASMGIAMGYGPRAHAAWYGIKTEAASRAKGRPKIVLFGGSNVLYGLRAEQIQRETGRPCVNFGTYAGLPFDYLVERVKKILTPGDILVFSSEWRHLVIPVHFCNDISMEFIVGCSPGYFKKLDWADQLSGIFGSTPSRLLLPFVVDRQENVAILAAVQDSVLDKKLSSWGDYIANTPEKQPPGALEAIHNTRVSAGFDRSYATGKTEYWSKVGDLIKWCKRRNVQIVYAAPAASDHAKDLHPEGPPFFDLVEKRYASLGMPVLVRQVDNLYPDELMFDMVYHLNARGATIRTSRLIEVLQPYVKSMPAAN